MNTCSAIHAVCLLILVINVKFIQCALPDEQQNGSVQEGGDGEVQIHGTDFVANGEIIENEISVAEANANFEAVDNSDSGEALEPDTDLAPNDVRPVSEVDASTKETIVRDSPIVPDARISLLKSDLDVAALVPNPTITDTDATQIESDPDASTSTYDKDHCIPSISDSHTTITLPEHDITPHVPDTGSTYLKSEADSSSLVPGSDSFFVIDIDVSPSVFVSDHTLNSDITSSLSNEHRTKSVPYRSSVTLMSHETSQKPEHELSTSISDDISADNHNIVSTSIIRIVLPEPGMTNIKQVTTNDVTMPDSRYDISKLATELQYHSASLKTTLSVEMTTYVVDHGHTSLTINHDRTLRPYYAITTPSPNHGMTTPDASSPDNDMTTLEETSSNNDMKTLETRYHNTYQQRIKQPDFNNTYHLLIYQLFTFINDSTNLHVGHKYRMPPNGDLWTVIPFPSICVVLIVILLQTIALYHEFRKTNKSAQWKLPTIPSLGKVLLHSAKNGTKSIILKGKKRSKLQTSN